MAWRRKGDKPLSRLMMAQFIDTCIRRSASVSLELPNLTIYYSYAIYRTPIVVAMHFPISFVVDTSLPRETFTS